MRPVRFRKFNKKRIKKVSKRIFEGHTFMAIAKKYSRTTCRKKPKKIIKPTLIPLEDATIVDKPVKLFRGTSVIKKLPDLEFDNDDNNEAIEDDIDFGIHIADITFIPQSTFYVFPLVSVQTIEIDKACHTMPIKHKKRTSIVSNDMLNYCCTW